MIGRTVHAVLVVALLTSLMWWTGAAPASAEGGWVCGAYDQTAKRNRTPVADGSGRVFPLVTIHGITGSDDDFDRTIDKSYIGANPLPPRSLLDAFAGSKRGEALPPGLEGVHVFSFSYTPDSLRWIDHAAVGGRFADTIDCLHERFGTPVSVVAHSMGGLVTRWVANSADSDGTARASKLGKVITLGTPYEGSMMSAIANGVTNVAADRNPVIAVLNHLCGASGTESGEGSCGPIPLYSSFRSEAGRKLAAGSADIAALSPWPRGLDVTALAGSQQVPMMLLGSPLNRQVDIGDLAVATSSAVADPGPGQVFTCSYDTATGTALTQWKKVLRTADPRDRQAELTRGFLASPCYHGNLMRYVELTNEVLGQLADWLQQHRAPLRTAPTWDEIKDATIPESCGHRATTLVDGKHTDIGPNDGYFELLRTLHNGASGIVTGVPSDAGPLTAVVVSCNAGGVGWPNSIMFFSHGGEYYGEADPGDGDWDAAGMYEPGREGVMGLWLKGDELEVYTTALAGHEPACCPSTSALVRFRTSAGGVTLTSLEEDLGD